MGDRLILKGYRRLRTGTSPELEMGLYLTDVVHYANCAPLAGVLEHRDKDGAPARRAGRYSPPHHEPYLALIRVLAVRTAELHRALSTPTKDPVFAPEPLSRSDVAGYRQAAGAH